VEELADSNSLGEFAPVQGLATCCHPELERELDDGLVTYMALRTEDEIMARTACDELHRRHARFLLAWCIKYRKETFGESAEDFVNITFLKAYREAERFVCTDPSRAADQVLAWLFRILKNLYLDSLRGEKRRPVVHCPDGDTEWLEEIEDQRQEAAAQVPKGRKAAILAFRETLSPKDREILTVTAEFWDPVKGEAVIDDDVRKGICKEYGLMDSSLRVRRLRLMARARAFVLGHANKITQ
jgi:RNA polymerase sigma factor (sigma-70 family)